MHAVVMIIIITKRENKENYVSEVTELVRLNHLTSTVGEDKA